MGALNKQSRLKGLRRLCGSVCAPSCPFYQGQGCQGKQAGNGECQRSGFRNGTGSSTGQGVEMLPGSIVDHHIPVRCGGGEVLARIARDITARRKGPLHSRSGY